MSKEEMWKGTRGAGGGLPEWTNWLVKHEMSKEVMDFRLAVDMECVIIESAVSPPSTYIDADEKCSRGNCSNKAQAPHPCTYASDVHNDNETLCNCCEDCEIKCARDI